MLVAVASPRVEFRVDCEKAPAQVSGVPGGEGGGGRRHWLVRPTLCLRNAPAHYDVQLRHLDYETIV